MRFSPGLLLCVLAGCLLGAAGAHAQLVRQANTTLALPSDLSNKFYEVANALGSLTFAAPIAARSQPGVTNKLFVVERGGKIQMVDLDTLTKTTFLDLAAYLTAQGTPIKTDGECGFLSFDFHPNYASNGYIYVFYSFTSGSAFYQRVARFTVNVPTNGTPAAATSVNTATHLPLITQRDLATNHNGGDLHFGPSDGYLYISVGDEGNANDSFDNARFINKDFFGAILRVDVDKKPGSLTPNAHSAVNPGAYAVPPDNPFIGATSHHTITIDPATVRTEIWSTGLRNPFRFSFDKPTGRLFVGDVGQDAYEEVDILTSGSDAGWSYYEGNHIGPSNRQTPTPTGTNFLFPIYEYPHSANANYTSNFIGSVITGGILYRGTTFQELYADYLFCDESSNHIWALHPNGSAWSVRILCDNNGGNIVAFGEDPRNGDALLCDITAGQIKHIVRSPGAGVEPPALLSKTGAFSNLSTLVPYAGIVAYAPNVSFWSDRADKQRWFSIPNTANKMTFSQDGSWTFPTGQVWIKHFTIQTTQGDPNTTRRLETRFLVKTASDVYGITYKWRADNSDADLVPETGQDEALTINVNGTPTQQVWHYPARSECRTCHTPVGGYALSFNTRQMNRTNAFGAQTLNQIKALSDAGYFTAAVPNVNNLPAFAPASDVTKSLEHRVRSYLAVNCVQCHQPGGAALGNWDARPSTATDAANLINGALNNSGGDAANRFAVPGDPAHSMLLKRLRGDGVPRMPPLATNVLDQSDIQLVTDWITADLPTRQTFAQWQTAKFGSTTAANAQPGADPDGDGLTNQQEYMTGTNPNTAASRWSMTLTASGGSGASTLSFPQTASRAFVIETSADLRTWSLWDVPGNQPDYSSATAIKTFTVTPTPGSPAQFFRARITQE